MSRRELKTGKIKEKGVHVKVGNYRYRCNDCQQRLSTSSRKNINDSMESYSERECERVKPIRVHGNKGPKSHFPGKRNEILALMR